jgi:hypothetical protein
LRAKARTLILAVLKNFITHGCLPVLLACLIAGCGKSNEPRGEVYVPRPAGTVTFNKDIAPIVFNNCSGCHRPGESAPFSLLAYEDVQKRAKLIMDVTQRRYMPPWLPDPDVVHLVGERRLTVDQLGLIEQWAEEGAAEGRREELPPLPKWNERWQLGEPDLVVKPKIAFSLAADGRDIYRNLVVPIPIEKRRYVRGMELKANSRALHHAFLRFDKTGQTRALDGKDGQPGFYGLHTPKSAESPITFASWQPGKTPRFYSDDLAWAMETNTDLVLQLHMQPIGKVESVAPEVAFYFTDKPGTAIASKLPLNSYTIEIPAGATNYVAADSFILPVDVELRGVLPHAHYLCRQMKGYADLPDGSRRWLMAINDWDFNWQGDYQFVTPVQLPKGTKLVMEYLYDNSTNNARNPNNPPKPVRYGMNSSDEMGELWLQIVMKSPQDSNAMTRALQPRFLKDQILTSEALLRQNPRDAKAVCDIGMALLMLGRNAEALAKLREALQIDPNYDEAHYFSGIAFRAVKQLDNARQEFETTLQLNPSHARARGNLGLVLAEQGDLAGAAQHFQLALQLNPQDEIARDMLQRIQQTLSGQRK